MSGSDRSGLLTLGESLGLVSTTGIGTLEIASGATIGIGGAESNVAIGVARLGQPVTWVGRLGRDAVGDLIERRLRADGVDCRVTRDESFTGIMVRHARTAGVTHVDYHRRGSAGSRLAPADVPAALIEGCAILHITGITPALSESAAAAVAHAVHAARLAGVAVSLDVNYRSKLWSAEQARRALTELAARVDVLFAGVTEAQLLLDTTEQRPDELARALACLGPTEVIIKAGAAGCVAYGCGGTLSQRAVPAVVVDPVGAGDAFVAGFLAERLAGEDLAQQLRTATAMGSYAVSVPGDCELLPTRGELDQMLHTSDVIR